MENSENNNKTKIWLYAVVFFTSAFIILLITAYSQSKFNRSIVDYERKISDKEKENNSFLLNLNTVMIENQALREELENTALLLKEKEGALSQLQKEIDGIKRYSEEVLLSYEYLTYAAAAYRKGNLPECGEILCDYVKKEHLSAGLQEEYEFLSKESFPSAAHKFYAEGYRQYKRGDYKAAVPHFIKSVGFSGKEYFSDDAYFLLGHAEYLLGNKDKAKEYLGILLDNYSDTIYRKRAEELLLSCT